MMHRVKNKNGFTLVETVLASLIMCAAVLSLGSISTRCLSETRLNRHYEVASMLLDRQLTMIDFMGIDEFVEADDMSGVFDEYDVNYRWEAQIESQDIDNLYLVRMTVSWPERNHIYSVSVDTLFDGKGILAETSEPTESSETSGEGE